jgi:hypothetical protein
VTGAARPRSSTAADTVPSGDPAGPPPSVGPDGLAPDDGPDPLAPDDGPDPLAPPAGQPAPDGLSTPTLLPQTVTGAVTGAAADRSLTSTVSAVPPEAAGEVSARSSTDPAVAAGLRGPDGSVRVGQRDGVDLFTVADVEQVGVGGGEWASRGSCGFRGDAVGQADRAVGAVVVAGAQTSGGVAGSGVDGQRFEQAELGEVEDGVVLLGSGQADQMIEDLGQSDRSQRAVTGLDQRPNVIGGGLVAEVGDDGVGVENCHRRRWAAVSSPRRAARRAVLVSGPQAAYLPRS